MRIDLDVEHPLLDALPRFQRSPFQSLRLLMMTIGVAGLAFAMLLAAVVVTFIAPGSIWRPLLCNNGAILMLLASGLQSAYWVSCWRRDALGHLPLNAPAWLRFIRQVLADAMAPIDEAQDGQEAPDRLSRFQRQIRKLGKTVTLHLGSASLWQGALALLALLTIMIGWNPTPTVTPLGSADYLTGGAALLLAFGLLVLERYFAGHTEGEWPEAAPIAHLARVVIVTLLLSSPCLFFSGDDTIWPARLATLAGLLPALVALELALRAVLSVFSPRHERLEPRFLANSFMAGLLRWHSHPLQNLQDELQNRFGIDLRQVWAFSFMRRAFLPVLSPIVLLGWLLSGIHEIPMDGRGIYERLGAPAEVLGPGLHAGLPWPLGRVQPVENGVVHELTTSLPSNGTNNEQDSSLAEGPAPDSANRLWDASHVSEKSQVIASVTNGRQSFQIVNMDVRFVYRIGLTDQAAMASIYHSADIPALIRSSASRVLVHDFASRTLDNVLGEQRTTLARDIGAAVQAELTRVSSGVDIIATIIEAIHPPAGAANAYHAVQASQITAQALIARERGRAAEQTNEAQMNANLAQDKATAAAHEAKASAEVSALNFAAEQKAYRSAGKAFLLEQYFSKLGSSLAKANVLILDHRIGGGSAPTIDLRNYVPPGEPVAARKASQ